MRDLEATGLAALWTPARAHAWWAAQRSETAPAAATAEARAALGEAAALPS